MACEGGLKTWLRFQIFNSKSNLKKSRTENKNDHATPKLSALFPGGMKLW